MAVPADAAALEPSPSPKPHTTTPPTEGAPPPPVVADSGGIPQMDTVLGVRVRGRGRGTRDKGREEGGISPGTEYPTPLLEEKEEREEDES